MSINIYTLKAIKGAITIVQPAKS